jgi:hypothetical protein
MAMTTRWRWPPESWCGCASSRRAACGSWTTGARGGGVQALVQAQRFADLTADGVQRVQRRHRFLEHHRDAVAAQRAPVVVGQADQLAAVEPDGARHARALRQQAHQGQRGHGLAAAGFADQPQRLAAAQFEADAAQRVGGAARGVERDAQAGHRQQRRVGHRGRRGLHHGPGVASSISRSR